MVHREPTGSKAIRDDAAEKVSDLSAVSFKISAEINGLHGTHWGTTKPKSGPKSLLGPRPPVTGNYDEDWSDDTLNQSKEETRSHDTREIEA